MCQYKWKKKFSKSLFCLANFSDTRVIKYIQRREIISKDFHRKNLEVLTYEWNNHHNQVCFVAHQINNALLDGLYMYFFFATTIPPRI